MNGPAFRGRGPTRPARYADGAFESSAGGADAPSTWAGSGQEAVDAGPLGPNQEQGGGHDGRENEQGQPLGEQEGDQAAGGLACLPARSGEHRGHEKVPQQGSGAFEHSHLGLLSQGGRQQLARAEIGIEALVDDRLSPALLCRRVRQSEVGGQAGPDAEHDLLPRGTGGRGALGDGEGG